MKNGVTFFFFFLNRSFGPKQRENTKSDTQRQAKRHRESQTDTYMSVSMAVSLGVL